MDGHISKLQQHCKTAENCKIPKVHVDIHIPGVETLEAQNLLHYDRLLPNRMDQEPGHITSNHSGHNKMNQANS
jgi:hypothetical protein